MKDETTGIGLSSYRKGAKGCINRPNGRAVVSSSCEVEGTTGRVALRCLGNEFPSISTCHHHTRSFEDFEQTLIYTPPVCTGERDDTFRLTAHEILVVP